MPPPFKQNPYTVLGLPRPSATQTTTTTWSEDPETETQYQATLKRAFRRTLLLHHPDKHNNSKDKLATTTASQRSGGRGKYSVDEIREAYEILRDRNRRAEWEKWIRLQRQRNGEDEGEVLGNHAIGEEEGLERLDLDDFSFVESAESASALSMPSSDSSSPPSPPLQPPQPQPKQNEPSYRDPEAPSSQHTPPSSQDDNTSTGGTWIKSCFRCGDPQGFIVTEQDLEDCIQRLETSGGAGRKVGGMDDREAEVLVGCGGCSLWVRVGFCVEED
jgi:diphthamide biosynthesis protein 4